MCSVKKVFLEILQNSRENTCARASFLIKLQASGLTLAQVFSCEFCEISKSIFFYRTPPAVASDVWINLTFFNLDSIFENLLVFLSFFGMCKLYLYSFSLPCHNKMSAFFGHKIVMTFSGAIFIHSPKPYTENFLMQATFLKSHFGMSVLL